MVSIALEHAITGEKLTSWSRLCLEIPCAGGRIMETGIQEFLDLKTSGKLGNSALHHDDQHCHVCRRLESDSFVAVPVIAVFTKYDGLIERANFDLDPIRIDGLSNERILTIAKDDAQKKLQAECIEPFEKRVGDQVPHVTVSSKSAIHSQIHVLN